MRVNQSLQDTAEFGNSASASNTPSGVLNMGGHARRRVQECVVYSQVTLGSAANNGPRQSRRRCRFCAADNLTVLDTIFLPENLAGNAVIKSDSSVVYALSQSGVMVLPVGSLNQYPRIQHQRPRSSVPG